MNDGRRSVAILVDDLVWWFDAGLRPSGIQRAALAVLDAALDRADLNAWAAVLERDRLVAIDRATLEHTPQGAAGVTLGRAKAIVKAVPMPASVFAGAKRVHRWLGAWLYRRRATAEKPPPDVVIVPGAFWAGDEWRASVRRLAGRMPVRVTIYDLFPITNPEWVAGELHHEFLDSMSSVVPLCDRIVALGETPAAHIREHYPHLQAKIRVAVPDLAAHASSQPLQATRPSPVDGPYVLAVGTVEPRKNHRTILDAWALARRELGFGSLVIAGRPGLEDLEAEMEGDADRLSLVRITNADDAELDSLYAGASATVHASWAEGFGLPARESIVRGVPALMADGFQLFDPADSEALATLMIAALKSPTRLEPARRGQRSGWEPVLAALVD
jgi:glycosyltransferase involved in cell wall biosynthesis